MTAAPGGCWELCVCACVCACTVREWVNDVKASSPGLLWVGAIRGETTCKDEGGGHVKYSWSHGGGRHTRPMSIYPFSNNGLIPAVTRLRVRLKFGAADTPHSELRDPVEHRRTCPQDIHSLIFPFYCDFRIFHVQSLSTFMLHIYAPLYYPSHHFSCFQLFLTPESSSSSNAISSSSHTLFPRLFLELPLHRW